MNTATTMDSLWNLLRYGSQDEWKGGFTCLPFSRGFQRGGPVGLYVNLAFFFLLIFVNSVFSERRPERIGSKSELIPLPTIVWANLASSKEWLGRISRKSGVTTSANRYTVFASSVISEGRQDQVGLKSSFIPSADRNLGKFGV